MIQEARKTAPAESEIGLQDITREIEQIPTDTEPLDLFQKLEHVLMSMARLPDPQAEAVLTHSIKSRFNLNTHQLEAYRRQLRLCQKELSPTSGNETSKEADPTYSALLPGLVDVVVDSEDIPAFLMLSDNQLQVLPQVESGGVVYSPPPIEQIPEPIPRAEAVLKIWKFEDQFSVEEVDSALFDDLHTYFLSISELPDPLYYLLLVIWSVHTHIVEFFQYSPILSFYAVPERGKTRTGKAILYICRRGLHTETLREPYIIRFADRMGGTIFFDVMNLWFKAQKTGLEDLLLQRFERGAKVPRVLYPDKGPFKDTKYFGVFGPTLIATNEPIHRILDSRCLNITMPQTARQFPDDVTPGSSRPLKERLLCFRARHMERPLPEIPKIASGRLGDILRPLHQILLLMKPEAESNFTELVEMIKSQRAEDKRETLEARLLSTMLRLSKERDGSGSLLWNNKIPIKQIATRLNNGLPEKEWTITYQKVGKLIKSLGLETGTLHGGNSAVVWDEEQHMRIAEAYGVQKTSP
jgi:hypothetical protein